MNQITYPVHTPPQWRPRSMAPVRQMGVALRPQLRVVTRRLGQASKVAQGADIVSGILTGGAALVSGIALAVFVGGGESRGSLPATPRPTWRWIGGITAVLGAVKIFNDISKGTAVTSGADVANQ